MIAPLKTEGDTATSEPTTVPRKPKPKRIKPIVEVHIAEAKDAVQVAVANASERISTWRRQEYTLSFVLTIAILAFLLGSLFRSLLSPADFILYGTPTLSGIGGSKNALSSGAALGADVLREIGQEWAAAEGWREVRRLVELKSMMGWDLVVGIVRR